DFVSHANWYFGQLIKHVKFGYDQPRCTVDHPRVAQQRKVKPTAAARASGDSSKFVAALTNMVTDRVEELCRKWPFANPSAVGFGHPNHRINRSRSDPGADHRATRNRAGGSHKRVGPMIDIEHGALCALEHHRM